MNPKDRIYLKTLIGICFLALAFHLLILDAKRRLHLRYNIFCKKQKMTIIFKLAMNPKFM